MCARIAARTGVQLPSPPFPYVRCPIWRQTGNKTDNKLITPPIYRRQCPIPRYRAIYILYARPFKSALVKDVLLLPIDLVMDLSFIVFSIDSFRRLRLVRSAKSLYEERNFGSANRNNLD